MINAHVGLADVKTAYYVGLTCVMIAPNDQARTKTAQVVVAGYVPAGPKTVYIFYGRASWRFEHQKVMPVQLGWSRL